MKHYQVTLCLNLDLYELSPLLGEMGIEIINIPIERKISPAQDLRAIIALMRIFNTHNFDLVHSITPKAGLLAALAARFAGIPIRIHTFTGQIWQNLDGFSRYLFKLIDWFIVQSSTHVCADSRSQIKYLEEQGVAPIGKILLLGAGSISGVDLSRFRPNEEVRKFLRNKFSCHESDCVFLFVGRLNREKGIYDLLNAFQKLSKHYLDAHLWIVGPDELETALTNERLLKYQNKNIHWIGSTFEPEKFMAAADVLVLPSYREGFGSVIIEAAACGIPAVAYQTTGVVDSIVEGETGFMCQKGSVTKLEEILSKLILNEKLRLYMGNAAMLRAQNLFSSITITEEWLDFYKNIFLEKKKYQSKSKRLFDITFVILISPLLIIPILFIAFSIKISSAGPIIFWSERVGVNGKIFLMPKFRTMYVNTPLVATDQLSDPGHHVTRFGKFLRKSSLDECPQLWSVLVGDMSMVGPRPALFNQADLIRLRGSAGIQDLAPGITGWAQINGRDEISVDEKVRLDIEYASNQSLSFDIKILYKTFFRVINRNNISH
jgi:lipopolysaccharide/colanic/teichoic acid biosynthesis glycosyltransferase